MEKMKLNEPERQALGESDFPQQAKHVKQQTDQNRPPPPLPPSYGFGAEEILILASAANNRRGNV